MHVSVFKGYTIFGEAGVNDFSLDVLCLTMWEGKGSEVDRAVKCLTRGSTRLFKFFRTSQ